MDELSDAFDPTRAKRRIEAQLHEASTAQEILNLQSELARVSVGNREIMDGARRRLFIKFDPAKQKLVALFDESTGKLKSEHAQARADETALCVKWDQDPNITTACSAQFAAAILEIEGYKASLLDPNFGCAGFPPFRHPFVESLKQILLDEAEALRLENEKLKAERASGLASREKALASRK